MKHLLLLSVLVALHTGIAGAALVGHYTFDNSGNLGADSQGFAPGSIVGTITPVIDLERNAVAQLNGSTSGHIHSDITLSGSGFTITAWVKSTSWHGNRYGNRGVFQFQDGGGATVSKTTKVIGGWINDTGVPWGRVIDTSGAQTMPQSQTGPTLSTGPSADWHFLAYRGDGSNYEVFLDGTKVGAASISYNGNLASHNTLILGRQGDEAWNGLIDDFRVYNEALSDSQLSALAIPEPTTAPLLAIASGIALFGRRRRSLLP